MNWLIAFTRDLTDVALLVMMAACIWEIAHKRWRPPSLVVLAVYLFCCASFLNMALRILRALI